MRVKIICRVAKLFPKAFSACPSLYGTELYKHQKVPFLRHAHRHIIVDLLRPFPLPFLAVKTFCKLHFLLNHPEELKKLQQKWRAGIPKEIDFAEEK